MALSPKEENLLKDDDLPECKIKRNYSCRHCAYCTQNPRHHLVHLRDIHGEKIFINKCNLCLYASRHYQKLVRHMRIVHGSIEGIPGPLRRRQIPELIEITETQQSDPDPPLPALLPAPVPAPVPVPVPTPLPVVQEEAISDFSNILKDLEDSRNSIRDLAVVYFAENQINKLMSQMEVSDINQAIECHNSLPLVKRKEDGLTFLEQLKNATLYEGYVRCDCGHVSQSPPEDVIHREFCDIMCPKAEEFEALQPTDLSVESTQCTICHQQYHTYDCLLSHLKDCWLTLASILMHTETAEVPATEDEQKDNLADADPNPNLEESLVSTCTNTEVELSENLKGGKHEDSGSVTDEANEELKDLDKDCYSGIQQAPGYGQATQKISADDGEPTTSMKKVFKCPGCNFWATTASRFHVHIVGHLNIKPFKCTQCAYRSKWQWDVTKHIRLKSVSNPCHRTARIIMDGETGCHNYEKYKKYEALMNITDKQSPLSKRKCNKKTHRKVELPIDVVCTKDTDDKIDMNEYISNVLSKKNIKSNSSSSSKPSDDLMTIDQFAGEERKSLYKCRRCTFRHNNRDAVLAHIKTHHQISRPSMPTGTTCKASSSKTKITVNIPGHSLSPEVQGEVLSSQNNTFELPNETDLVPMYDDVMCDDNSNSLANKNPDQTEKKKNSRLVEGGKISKRTSTFRCGHCHQVSNWKHVIQRHCRLRHAGVIQIEEYNRNCKRFASVCCPIPSVSLPKSSHELESSKIIDNQRSSLQHLQACHEDDEPSQPVPKVVDQQSPNINSTTFDENQFENQELHNLANTEDKADLEDLPSSVDFQPPNSLLQDMLSPHAEEDEFSLNNAPEPTIRVKYKPTPTHLKIISSCPKCPENFVDNTSDLLKHLQNHGAILPYKCEVCDFAAADKSVSLAHSYVHTTGYKNQNELIIKDCMEDPKYPNRQLLKVATPTCGTVWTVPTNRQFTPKADDTDTDKGLELTPHKTVFVNAKTGKVIKRN